MNLIQKLTEEAKAAPTRRVAMPECEAVKTLQAARRVLDDGIGTPVLVSPADVISATAEQAGVSLEGMEVVDTTDADALEERAARFMATNQRMLSDKGIRRKMKMPMWYAMVMEELGEVDCTFCGHTNTTGDVLMCAQMTIGLAEGVDVPSILALVDTPGFEGPEGSVICFTDCGLNPEPNASELASIAISACQEVDGVSSLLTGNLPDFMSGKKMSGKGVRVEMDGEGIVVNLFIVIRYGCAIADVAKKVQHTVYAALEGMTGFQVNAVNVHVGGISFN